MVYNQHGPYRNMRCSTILILIYRIRARKGQGHSPAGSGTIAASLEPRLDPHIRAFAHGCWRRRFREGGGHVIQYVSLCHEGYQYVLQALLNSRRIGE